MQSYESGGEKLTITLRAFNKQNYDYKIRKTAVDAQS
jgi:hypothetical protein